MAPIKAKFLAFWQPISGYCRGAPESVLFEVLNEPSGKLTPALWNDYLAEVLARSGRRTRPAPSSSDRASGTRLITWHQDQPEPA
ncbi:MAG: hypothetical protein WCQ21_07965 [Verrucomicrobiota bacterium]